MTEIAAISAFITSIKNATDIAKVIREAGVSLEKAEINFKLAELIGALADAKIQASEVKELLQEKDGQIAKLKKAFEMKDSLVREGDAYYKVNDAGKPNSSPYCSHCWEVNHIPVHLTQIVGGMGDWNCPACQNSYSRKTVSLC